MRKTNKNLMKRKLRSTRKQRRQNVYSHTFGNSSLQQIMEARYSKQTYRRTKNRRGSQSGRFRTDRRIYGFKTVLTYDQREIRGQLGRLKKKKKSNEGDKELEWGENPSSSCK